MFYWQYVISIQYLVGGTFASTQEILLRYMLTYIQ